VLAEWRNADYQPSDDIIYRMSTPNDILWAPTARRLVGNPACQDAERVPLARNFRVRSNGHEAPELRRGFGVIPTFADHAARASELGSAALSGDQQKVRSAASMSLGSAVSTKALPRVPWLSSFLLHAASAGLGVIARMAAYDIGVTMKAFAYRGDEPLICHSQVHQITQTVGLPGVVAL